MAKRRNSININFDNIDEVNKFINRVVREIASGQEDDPDSPFGYGISVKIEQSPIQTDMRQQSAMSRPIFVEKEPLVDIIERANQITLIMEIPGFRKSDMRVSANNFRVAISASYKGKNYARNINLPSWVDPSSASGMYNNGILEISFNKSEAKARDTVIELE